MTDGDALTHSEWVALLGGAGVAAPLAGGLAAYLTLLARWAGAVDLLAEPGEREVVLRHVLESLAALPWLASAGRLLDIGSGNGFPAIPLLLARPAMSGVLLEPRERRWAFLREVVRDLGLDTEVRRERVSEHRGEGYTVLTIRGVALEAWLPYAPRLAGADGTVLWWTSRDNAGALSHKVSPERVLPFPLADSGRGCLAVWRRCST